MRIQIMRTCAGAGLFALGAAGYADTPVKPIDFASQIAPILAERCYVCHGPDARRGGLRLGTREEAIAGGESRRPAIKPGDPNGSNLLTRITEESAERRMPLKKDRLPDDEIALLTEWIAQGASFGSGKQPNADIWSFKKPVQAPVPPGAKNPIDAFVRAKLAEHRLAPSPEADRNTLVRRLSLDLRGLPPSPEEVAAFANDPRPDAYARLVEQFLGSPQYGERMAVPWLDLVRFADTNGYEKDRPRPVWPYRDWVIRAFNDDLPYDRFIIEQIAGDLLPQATPEQRVATGFLRNSLINEEGGIDIEEFRYEAMVDRTNTTATAVLGLTLGCAQCHNHKFDAFTQREYFQFTAFLDNTDDIEYSVPSSEISRKRERIQTRIDERVANLAGAFPVDEPQVEAAVFRPNAVESLAGATLERPTDDEIVAGGAAPDKDIYRITLPVPDRGTQGIRIEVMSDPGNPESGPGRSATANFVLTALRLARVTESGETPLAFTSAEADYSQPEFTPDLAIATKEGPKGWAVSGPNDAKGANHYATFWLKDPIPAGETGTLNLELKQNYGGQHTLRRFRVWSVRKVFPPSGVPEAERRAAFLAKKMDAWEADAKSKARHWSVLQPVEYVSKNHATFEKLDDGSLLMKGDNPNTDTYEVAYALPLQGAAALRLEALPDERLPNNGPGRGTIMSEGDFFLSEIAASVAPWSTPEKAQRVTLQNASEDFAGAGHGAALALDGKIDTGWQIIGQPGKAHAAVYEFAQPIGFDGGALLRIRLDQVYVHQHTLGRFRVSVTMDPLPVRASGFPAEIETILALDAPSRNDQQRRALKHYYLSIAPELAEECAKIDELRARLPQYPKCLAVAERETPRVTRIHHRGEFLSPREAVQPGVPAVLPPLPEEAPRNRLAFARWLVGRENPLAARVAVNRLWQTIFGRGFVETTEDFGIKGAAPSNQELLDWLAVEFMRRDWSQKEMLRLIVNSETYRQDSRATPEMLDKDPANIWLARSPRYRVEAETVRDIALASSGLINLAVGGPSVKPPVPEALLKTVYDAGWNESAGPDRYRRGVYVYIKRTLPYPSLSVFDAPARDRTCPRRVRANSPLQALTLLNDPVFTEAAAAMAKRVLKDAPQDDDARIRHAFNLCTARNPDAQEAEWTRAFLNERRAQEPAEEKLWAMLCRALLNLDETVTRT